MIHSIGNLVVYPVAAIVGITKFLWNGWMHLLMPIVEVAYVLSIVTLGISYGFLLMYLTDMQVPIIVSSLAFWHQDDYEIVFDCWLKRTK